MLVREQKFCLPTLHLKRLMGKACDQKKKKNGGPKSTIEVISMGEVPIFSGQNSDLQNKSHSMNGCVSFMDK